LIKDMAASRLAAFDDDDEFAYFDADDDEYDD
jgi:hypothetical protein